MLNKINDSKDEAQSKYDKNRITPEQTKKQ